LSPQFSDVPVIFYDLNAEEQWHSNGENSVIQSLILETFVLTVVRSEIRP